MTLYYDDNGVAKKMPKNYEATKNMEGKYHFLRKIIQRRVVLVSKIAHEETLIDPFTKFMSFRVF